MWLFPLLVVASHVGVGLVYRCSNLHVGDIEDCTIFLKTFDTCCESSVDVTPSQAFFLRKRRELGPLCRPLPSWICIDTVTLCPGVVDPESPISSYLFHTGADFPHDAGHKPLLQRHTGEGNGLHSTSSGTCKTPDPSGEWLPSNTWMVYENGCR